MSTRKTDHEIQELKRDWESDPIWDIEHTEGFEDHYNELLAFRLTKEAEWADLRKAELRKFAQKIGTDSLDLALYLRRLENRVKELEDLVWHLHNPNP